MILLWPWSETYGGSEFVNFIGRMGYGFFAVIGLGLIVYWISLAF